MGAAAVAGVVLLLGLAADAVFQLPAKNNRKQFLERPGAASKITAKRSTVRLRQNHHIASIGLDPAAPAHRDQ